MRSRKPCVAMQHRAFLLSMTRSELLCCGATCIFFGAKCCAVKPDTLDCAIRKTGEERGASAPCDQQCARRRIGHVRPGAVSNRGAYDPCNGAFVDLMALVVPEALPVIPGTSGPSTEPLPKGVSAASVRWGCQSTRPRRTAPAVFGAG